MKRLTMLSAGVACAILLVPAAPFAASREPAAPEEASVLEPPTSPCAARADELFGIRGDLGDPDGRDLRSVGEETLWIFDADFEDLSGDNAGWTSLDMSGTLEQINYWHKDTIRINGFEWLGDSTWWCGTYNDCWRQPRGYGNGWTCVLSRDCSEVETLTDVGDSLVLSFDQRFAMEHDYDYGYVDVLADGDPGWTTIVSVNNPGFAGSSGISHDWDHTGPGAYGGHVVLDISEYAGRSIDLRFRFVSDLAYSSQDQFDNPPFHSVQDGAWQLDNIRLDAWTPDSVLVFLDDCESPGDNGWVHDNIPGSEQTGVVFERVFAPDMLRPWCGWPREHWWMAALDAETGRMVAGQNSWLISPPIDISGADGLVGRWDGWVDLGGSSPPRDDFYRLYLSTGFDPECVLELPNFIVAHPGNWPYGGPYVVQETEDWGGWAWGDWFAINWRLYNAEPLEPGVEHWTGLMLDRQRVGVPVGGPPTQWDYYIWDRFHDTFVLSEALIDTATVIISDGDGITSARLIVSSDAGQTWDNLPLIRQSPESNWWRVPPPTAHIAEHTEVRYYFEATDGVGNVRTHPKAAPDAYYEFSILPIKGSVSEPCILLVDKHGRTTPDSDRVARHTSEYSYREALDILGFEYDVFDVNVPSGFILSEGPDSSGMKYYDTQVWFTNDFNAYTLRASDQINLIWWLGQADEGKERNLLLTGNDIGNELIGAGNETLGFYTDWLATDYVQDGTGDWTDTMSIIRDVAGGFDFMTHDDGQSRLWDDG